MGALIEYRREGRAVAPGTGMKGGQYLSFQLGGEVYAIAILRVREIIEYGRVTPVPMMPAWMRGVINLRGAVVPVVDLCARFGGAPAVAGRRACIVIVEAGGEEGVDVLGVVVDAVHEVVDIDAAAIESDSASPSTTASPLQGSPFGTMFPSTSTWSGATLSDSTARRIAQSEACRMLSSAMIVIGAATTETIEVAIISS